MMLRPLRIRLSLRLRVTFAFAGAMALLLGALGMFVYARVQSGLDRSPNEGLRSRTEDVRALVLQADSGLKQAGQSSLATPRERFAQILATDGRVLDRTPLLPPQALLDRAQLSRAAIAPLLINREQVPGQAGSSRLLAIAVRAQGERMIVLVGTSLRQRDATLAELRAVLLLGGPVALLLASLLGYAAAAFALRAVERMRSHAQDLSLDEPGQRLPIPSTRDELERLASTLNEMLARNETAIARERASVANASHELRSPLAILRAELDVALVGDSSRAELRDAIASSAEEAARLSALAENLLTLAEADQESLQLRRERIDIAQSLERLQQRFTAITHAAGAVLRTRAPLALRIHADPLRLEQALGNLIDNAVHSGASTIEVLLERRGRAVLLRVLDDGPGFPAALLETAFERFTRADEVRTTGGTGLGLSIVRSIARTHGGEAHIANRQGDGAEVWLSLPDCVCVEGVSEREALATDSNSMPGTLPAR